MLQACRFCRRAERAVALASVRPLLVLRGVPPTQTPTLCGRLYSVTPCARTRFPRARQTSTCQAAPPPATTGTRPTARRAAAALTKPALSSGSLGDGNGSAEWRGMQHAARSFHRMLAFFTHTHACTHNTTQQNLWYEESITHALFFISKTSLLPKAPTALCVVAVDAQSRILQSLVALQCKQSQQLCTCRQWVLRRA